MRPQVCSVLVWSVSRARIHESVITYDGHISRPGITELELGPSENLYSRARKRSDMAFLLGFGKCP